MKKFQIMTWASPSTIIKDGKENTVFGALCGTRLWHSIHWEVTVHLEYTLSKKWMESKADKGVSNIGRPSKLASVFSNTVYKYYWAYKLKNDSKEWIWTNANPPHFERGSLPFIWLFSSYFRWKLAIYTSQCFPKMKEAMLSWDSFKAIHTCSF